MTSQLSELDKKPGQTGVDSRAGRSTRFALDSATGRLNRAQLRATLVPLLGSLVVFLTLWEIAVRALQVSPIILPAPSRVFYSLWALLRSDLLPKHAGITLFETLTGFSIGAVAGITLGSLVAESKPVGRIVYPYIIAFQSLPKVAIAPLLLIWFGFGLESKIAMTALISFFPILVNTSVGLRNVDQEYLDLMTSLTATRWQTFVFVKFPNSLPFIFAGLEVGVVLSVIGAIVGEFVGAKGGLGYLILTSQARLDVAGMFALLLILSAMGLTLNWLIVTVRRRLAFWAEASADRYLGV